MTQPRQVVGAGQSPNDYVAAIPAIAAVGSAFRNVLFSPKAATAPSAVSSFDVDGNAIDKHAKALRILESPVSRIHLRECNHVPCYPLLIAAMRLFISS